MDDIYYEPIKEDAPAELVIEGVIRHIARMEAAREVERVIGCLETRTIVFGSKEYRVWK